MSLHKASHLFKRLRLLFRRLAMPPREKQHTDTKNTRSIQLEKRTRMNEKPTPSEHRRLRATQAAMVECRIRAETQKEFRMRADETKKVFMNEIRSLEREILSMSNPSEWKKYLSQDSTPQSDEARRLEKELSSLRLSNILLFLENEARTEQKTYLNSIQIKDLFHQPTLITAESKEIFTPEKVEEMKPDPVGEDLPEPKEEESIQSPMKEEPSNIPEVTT